jgi:hypothetical protein
MLTSSAFLQLGFEPESPTHSLLGFIKAVHGKADAKLALEVIAGRFDRKSKVERSAEVLLKHGYITLQKNGKWTITSDGNNMLIRASGVKKRVGGF